MGRENERRNAFGKNECNGGALWPSGATTQVAKIKNSFQRIKINQEMPLMITNWPFNKLCIVHVYMKFLTQYFPRPDNNK